MTPEGRKLFQNQEEARLLNYQHQHRGLRFLKLFLPPTEDIKVNLVGVNNNIYKGSIPITPDDQLPPNIEKSIDEEALYKEIRDMNFPPVPRQEPLGPSRRIGGEYTLTKRIVLEPVEINYREGLQETLLLGKNGNLYKGTEKYPSTIELAKQLRGTKRVYTKVRHTSSSRGFVEPSLVTLQTDQPGKYKNKSLLEMPRNDIEKIQHLLTNQNARKKEVRIKESIEEDKKERKEKETSDKTESLSQNEAVDETSAVFTQETEQSEGSIEELDDKIGSQENENSDESESLIQNEAIDETSTYESSEPSEEIE